MTWKHLALLILFPGFGLGQSEIQPVTLECSVSQQEITVGDPIEFRVLIRFREGIEIAPLPAEWDFGDLEVLDTQPIDTAENLPEDGTETHVQGRLFRIAAFEPGTFKTPSLEISYTAVGESEAAKASCDPLTIQVTSVLPEDAEDLKDIKQPLDLPAESSYWWLWLLLGGLLLAAVWWLLQRRSQPEKAVAVQPKPSLPPYDEAIAALERLESQKLPEQGESKRHYVELSEIIRRYIQRVYQVPAREMTSEEILAGLRSQQRSPELLADLRKLLSESDLVKFAKWIPGAERDRELLTLTREWLELTRPGTDPGQESKAENGEEPA